MGKGTVVDDGIANAAQGEPVFCQPVGCGVELGVANAGAQVADDDVAGRRTGIVVGQQATDNDAAGRCLARQGKVATAHRYLHRSRYDTADFEEDVARPRRIECCLQRTRARYIEIGDVDDLPSAATAGLSTETFGTGKGRNLRSER